MSFHRRDELARVRQQVSSADGASKSYHCQQCRQSSSDHRHHRVLCKRHSISDISEFEEDTFLVDIPSTMQHILQHEDTSGSQQVTVESQGPKHMTLPLFNRTRRKADTIQGHYMISMLMQQMALLDPALFNTTTDYNSSSSGGDNGSSLDVSDILKKQRLAIVSRKSLLENPVDCLLRAINDRFTPALVRRMDASGLKLLLSDTKMMRQVQHQGIGVIAPRIYVPSTDLIALKYYEDLRSHQSEYADLEVIVLPPAAQITAGFVQSLNRSPGILALQLWNRKRPVTSQSCLNELDGDDLTQNAPTIDLEAAPFMVPGGRFNEMYGWDSYFMLLGLLKMDQARISSNSTEQRPKASCSAIEVAKGMVDNLVYQICHYGRILNANRTYYLMRSQPPFLTSMIWALMDAAAAQRQIEDLENAERQCIESIDDEWMDMAMFAAMKEYHEVWMSSPRKRLIPCSTITMDQHSLGAGDDDYDVESTVDEQSLNHEMHEHTLTCYGGLGQGVPPETEESHFDQVLGPYAQRMDMDVSQFIEVFNDKNQVVEGRQVLEEYFSHDGAVRESGHDTTVRLDGCAAHLATIDLCSCLHKYEMDIARYLDLRANEICKAQADQMDASKRCMVNLWQYGTAEDWRRAAKERRQAASHLLWNEEDGVFCDYDVRRGIQKTYHSATMLWALWSGLASEEQAKRIVLDGALDKLEESGGLVSGTLESLMREKSTSIDAPNRQWDYPCGWAPHQMLAWLGLQAYGFNDVAKRLAYRWALMITDTCFNFHGIVPEKFNVVQRTHKVESEYGNVNADIKLVAREGFGWMNASYLLAWSILDKKERRSLRLLASPEVVFSLEQH